MRQLPDLLCAFMRVRLSFCNHGVSSWLQASETLTEGSAKQLLLQWQNVKAKALGDHVFCLSDGSLTKALCLPALEVLYTHSF